MIVKPWFRSIFCGNSSCVEVQHTDTATLVRNNLDPGRILSFDPVEWEAFVQAVKYGQFDRQ